MSESWDVRQMKFDHEDDRRSICDWIKKIELKKTFGKVSAFWGKKGKSIGGHYHSDQWCIYFGLVGNGIMVLYNTKTTKVSEFEFKPRTWAYIPPGVAIEIRFKTDVILEMASTTDKYDKSDVVVVSMDKYFK